MRDDQPTFTPAEPVRVGPAGVDADPERTATVAAIVFVIGLAVLLHAGVQAIARFGPSVSRSGVVEVLRTEPSFRSASYHVIGRDERGARFDHTVSKDILQRLRPGDEVTVERSTVTGAVVGLSGPDWVSDESWQRALAMVLPFVGTALMVGSVVRGRRAMSRVSPTTSRHLLAGVAGVSALAVTAAGILVWRGHVDAGSSTRPAAGASCVLSPVAQSLIQVGLMDGTWTDDDQRIDHRTGSSCRLRRGPRGVRRGPLGRRLAHLRQPERTRPRAVHAMRRRALDVQVALALASSRSFAAEASSAG